MCRGVLRKSKLPELAFVDLDVEEHIGEVHTFLPIALLELFFARCQVADLNFEIRQEVVEVSAGIQADSELQSVGLSVILLCYTEGVDACELVPADFLDGSYGLPLQHLLPEEGAVALGVQVVCCVAGSRFCSEGEAVVVLEEVHDPFASVEDIPV